MCNKHVAEAGDPPGHTAMALQNGLG